MAAGIKASRVAFWVLAVIAVLALAAYAKFSISKLPPAAEICAPLPANMKSIGPALTVAQVEAESLEEMKGAPAGVPRVPFGYNNSEWLALKKLMRPGDTVHEFQTEITGGHLVLRQRCFIAQLVTWTR